MPVDLDTNVIVTQQAIREAVKYKKENPVFKIDSLDLPDKLGLKVWGQEKNPEPKASKNKPPLPDSAIGDPSDEKRTRGNMPSDSTISIWARRDQSPTTKPDTSPIDVGGDLDFRPPLATGMEPNSGGISKKLPEGQGTSRGTET